MKKYIIGGIVLGVLGLVALMLFLREPSPELNTITEVENKLSQEDILQKVSAPVSRETLPPDIHPDQVVKVVDNHYAVVVRPSMNIDLPNIPVNFKAEYRGVLQWDDTGKKWEKFLVVEDTNTKVSQSNNPVDFWFEGKPDTDMVANLLIVDVNGAGSGEGLGKVLVPDNIGMDEWNVVECFDYALDLGKGKSRDIQSKECQAVKIRLAPQSGRRE